MVKKIFTKRYIIFVLLLIIVLTSANYGRIKTTNSKKLYKKVKAEYLEYKNLSIKSKIKINFKDKHYKLKASIKITKDSIIWINLVHSTGVSILRLELTKDSIKFINKLDKTYFLGDYNKIKDLTHIKFDYKSLQSILTNELFSLNNKNKTKEHKIDKIFYNFYSLKDSNKFVMQNLKPKEIKKYINKQKGKINLLERFFIAKETYKIDSVNIEELNTKNKINIVYSDFNAINNKKMPSSINVKIYNDSLVMSAKIKPYKIKISKSNKYSFKISDKYKQIKFKN